jgi:ribosomal-protein-alanine N-acetyltransferase
VLPDGYEVQDLTPDHAAEMAAAYDRNRAHLAPWDPRRPEEFYTVQGQDAAIADQLAQARMGLVHPWVLVRGDVVVGRINLNNVVMGVLRSAAVGYWVDAAHTGRGLATGAVEFAVEQARARGLHRVEAGTLVHNTASQAVLARCGFTHYGTAEKFLFIDGAWQDHHLFQRILHDDPL